VGEPVEYEIQIATDSDFETLVDKDRVSLNRYVHDSPFPPGQYHWRVRAIPYGEDPTNWSGLDEAQKLFDIGAVGHALLAVGGGHFQTVTIRHDFTSFLLEPFFELTPIGPGIYATCQDRHHIDDGEDPFLIFRVPSAADLLFLEE